MTKMSVSSNTFIDDLVCLNRIKQEIQTHSYQLIPFNKFITI